MVQGVWDGWRRGYMAQEAWDGRGGYMVQVCARAVRCVMPFRCARTCGCVRVCRRVCVGVYVCASVPVRHCVCERGPVNSMPGGTWCARGHVPVVAVWQESVVEGAPRRKRGRARSDEGVHSRAHTHTRRPRERGCILCRVVVACLGHVDDAGGGVVFWARPVLEMTGDGMCLHEGMLNGAYRRISGEGKLE